MAPSVRDEPLSSPRASNPTVASTPVMMGILTADFLETDEGNRPMTSSGLQHTVLLSDSASFGRSDLPEIGGASKCNLV